MTVTGARPLYATDPVTLGGVELLGRLGEGGMGVVYLGRNAAGQLVAVKAIRAHLAGEPGFRRRFRSEVTQVRQVPPYCTAEVLDADPDSNPPYLVVEYVDGPTLSDVVAESGKLSPATLHSVAIGVATALTAIHGAGVIHRDLKPSNVLLARGSLKVIDFGIARPVADASTLTNAGEIVGTVSYMAPERLGPDGSRLLTPAADVFAWGAVVAYAGRGRAPFVADSVPGVAMRIISGEPELDGLPPAIRDLVRLALAKDPAARPTARALLEALTSAGDARPISVPPGLVPGTPEPPTQLRTASPYPPTQPLSPVGDRATEVRRPDPPTVPRQGGRPQSVAGASAAALAAPPATVAAAAPPRRRPWRLVAGVVAAVVTLALAGAIATRTIPLPFGLAAVGPTPSATANGSSASGSSPPATLEALLAGLSTVEADTLSPPKDWMDVSDTHIHADCAGSGQGLLVTRASDSPYRCPGPKTLLLDTAVLVDVELQDTFSCGTIWLRFGDTAGYALRVCPDGYHLILHGWPTGSSVKSVCDPVPSPLVPGQRIRVGVVLRGNQFTFFRDGKQIGRNACTDPAQTFRVGHVVLGIFPSVSLTSATPSSQVRLSNVEIRGSTS